LSETALGISSRQASFQMGSKRAFDVLAPSPCWDPDSEREPSRPAIPKGFGITDFRGHAASANIRASTTGTGASS
jgi:hypothetical protein